MYDMQQGARKGLAPPPNRISWRKIGLAVVGFFVLLSVAIHRQPTAIEHQAGSPQHSLAIPLSRNIGSYFLGRQSHRTPLQWCPKFLYADSRDPYCRRADTSQAEPSAANDSALGRCWELPDQALKGAGPWHTDIAIEPREALAVVVEAEAWC
jgi:hypothetical protein